MTFVMGPAFARRVSWSFSFWFLFLRRRPLAGSGVVNRVAGNVDVRLGRLPAVLLVTGSEGGGEGRPALNSQVGALPCPRLGGCPYVFVKCQTDVDERSLGSSFLGVPRSRPACAGRLSSSGFMRRRGVAGFRGRTPCFSASRR